MAFVRACPPVTGVRYWLRAVHEDVPVCPPDRAGLSGDTADTGFPRWARLSRAEDFKNLFAQPTKSVDSCFTVLARYNDHRPARLGLAISKKYARRAVDRNRIKRIVRESFRHYRHHLYGIDLVVFCRYHTAISPNSRLMSSLAVHWKRIRERLCVLC